jgi:hypothetical protein
MVVAWPELTTAFATVGLLVEAAWFALLVYAAWAIF